MNIENKIYQLSSEIFGLDFQQYKHATGRELLGVCINSQKREFEHLFGEFPANFLSTINSQFIDTIAGYKVDVGAYFLDLQLSADVFLLNKNELNSSDKDIDSLLIHELCHMIIDSHSIKHINITINKNDKDNGKKLYNMTDKENVKYTKHTDQFCKLLSAASKIAAKKYPKEFIDRWDCINSAMRYDLKGSLRT